MWEEFALLAVALVVGFLVGLTGVGGGAIMTPILILGFGTNPLVAVATDLVYATIVKTVAALIHGKARNVDWPVLRSLWLGSIPGVILGIAVVLLLLRGDIGVLNVLLALLLVLSGVSMLQSKRPKSRNPLRPQTVGLFGGFIGFSVATTSIGAGALGMAVLRRILGDANPKQLVGTDILHAIPIALLAGGTYWAAGLLDWQLLGILLAGSLPGAVIGSMLVSRVNAQILRRILGLVLLAAAAGLLLK